jgi:multiple sugar transport system substrate-binding protein
MTALHGITWDHPRGYDCLVAASAVLKEKTGIDILWDKRSLKDFGDAPLVELARDYDLLIIDHPHSGEAAASGVLHPLDTLIQPDDLEDLARQSVGPSFSSYHWQGHQWALPLDAACQVGSYRPDKLAPHELPSTWNDFFLFAADLNRKGYRCAMALCPTDALCSFLTLSAQAGHGPSEKGFWMNEDMFQFILEILQKILAVCVPDSISWNPIRLYEALSSSANSELVYAPLAFGYTNYARAGYRTNRLGFTGIPGERGALLGGTGIAVSRRVDDPNLASTAALWLCQAECQSGVYLRDGGQPGNLSTWYDKAADSLCGGFFSSTLKTINQSWQRPRFSGWPAFQEHLGNQIHACLTGNLSPSSAYRDLSQQFETIFTLSQNHTR